MSGVLEMRVLELLVARLCHDLAGPVAAIASGSELLADEVPNFAGETLRLLTDSAGQAAGRLQFYRFVYGFGAPVTAPSTTPAELAARFFSPTPIACEYTPPVRLLTPVWQKLACNLLLAGAAGLPRGGRLTVSAGATGPVLDAEGEGVVLSTELTSALTLNVPPAALTPRTVQAYVAGLLARDMGRRLVPGNTQAGRFRISTAAGAERVEEVRASSAA